MDDDEDWFFESINRYKNLSMFELEQPIHQVEPVSASSICVACSNKQRHQLLELSLPSKLLSQTRESSDNAIKSDTDMKIKCGTFTEAMCFQIKPVNESLLVVSHLNMEGAHFYSFSSDSDQIKKEPTQIKCQLESPMMAVDESHIWLTSKRADQIILYDMNAERCIENFKLLEHNTPIQCDERIVPMFLGPKSLAFGCQVTGGIGFVDHRSPSPVFNTSVAGPDVVESSDNSLWSFTSLYECSKHCGTSEQSACFAKISTTGKLIVYDTRNTSLPAYVNNLCLKSEEDIPLQIRFKPSNKDWISVSGFDGNVYVYKLQEGDENRVFTHDGHKHVEGYSSQTRVTSHLWTKEENLIISSADNGTIQMWQFENKQS